MAGTDIEMLTRASDLGENVAIEHFGASADCQTPFREFGFTTDNVVAAGRRSLAKTT